MADRDKDGKFIKGHKGFKKKRPHFRLLQKKLKDCEPELVEEAFKQAMNGKNPQMFIFMLSKMYGKEPFSDFQLSGKDAVEVSKNLLAAIGTVDPQVLNNASQLLQGHLKVQESEDFEKRLQALEDKQ